MYRTAELGGLERALAGQDAERARALAVLLEALGLAIPEAVGDRDGLPEAALAVLDARGSAGLRAAIAYEQTLIDGCAAALGKLEEPNAIRTVATVHGGPRPAPGAAPARGRDRPALIRGVIRTAMMVRRPLCIGAPRR